jgi:hypothetical protein
MSVHVISANEKFTLTGRLKGRIDLIGFTLSHASREFDQPPTVRGVPKDSGVG